MPNLAADLDIASVSESLVSPQLTPERICQAKHVTIEDAVLLGWIRAHHEGGQMAQSAEDVARESIECYNAGDFDRLRSLLADD